MGRDGERRKTYSAAMIRKTDSKLNKDEDIIVCLPGARIEHVTEIVQRIMGRGNGGTSSHRDEQHGHGRNNSDTEEIQESTEEDEGSK